MREATVVRESRTNLSRGFGFIKMGSQMLVDKILKEEHQIWDNSVTVKLAADVTVEPEKPAPVEAAIDDKKDALMEPEADPELEAEIKKAEAAAAAGRKNESHGGWDRNSDSKDSWSDSKDSWSRSKGSSDGNNSWGNEDRRGGRS